MKLRKHTSLCLVMVIIMSVIAGTSDLSASATPTDSAFTSSVTTGASLRWTNVSSINAMLAFNGSTASCKTEIVAFMGTTLIVADMYLYLKTGANSYTLADSWLNNRVYADYLYVSKSATIARGRTYKLLISAYVTRNGYMESVSCSVEATAP
jgi:hypothetical protein